MYRLSMIFIDAYLPAAFWEDASGALCTSSVFVLSKSRHLLHLVTQVRLNHSERLRSWAFAELGKGLNATERLHQLERWPERHNVLMIPWVQLACDSERMHDAW